ncbi:MAG: stage II sporulation protein M [Candidatus Bathyarchaeota archaeon]|jgi:uncharacterized membrane protein SpoIIM required for sporulation|nr:hypothetical protein [Candidatus Bathyarchaeota archaeon A05DMB-5]MDH7557398.1 stage II sporulation protein M [Candidatus Bathyarchaeota archaeon]
MKFEFWNQFSPFHKRIFVIAVFFIISVIVTIAGTLIPLSAAEADEINDTVNQTRNTLNNMPLLNQVTFIFGNNFFICLLAFIPIAGIFLELYALFSTGITIAGLSYGLAHPSLVFLNLLVLPFGLLEFIAYSIGISEGVWLFWRIIKHRGRKELVYASMFITICALLLLAAAFIEIGINALLS